MPVTLADEAALLGEQLEAAEGPIHLVGHSYGGAVAFKMATSEPWASRIRSLTLIEPVLPTLLCDNAADRRLHADLFRSLERHVYGSARALPHVLERFGPSGNAVRRSAAAH